MSWNRVRVLLLAVVMAGALPAGGVAGASDQAASTPRPPSDADCGADATKRDRSDSVRVLIPFASPVGFSNCPGVRPGALVLMTTLEGRNVSCTLSFLWRGGDNRLYIGTAGHCILDDIPGEHERTWAAGRGPAARDSGGNRIGEFAFAELGFTKDFALIRLDPGVNVSAQMCHFGGPTGSNHDRSSSLVTLHHYGHGLGIGWVVPGRTSVASDMTDSQMVHAAGLALPGDSGSGVISADGRAVGTLVNIGAGINSNLGVDGGIGVTRMGPQMHRAVQALGMHFRLQTAGLR